MKVDDLKKKLKERGYKDDDAIDEIIDELRTKNPGDEKRQKQRLDQKFLKPDDKAVQKLDKEYGDKKRAKKAGQPGTDADSQSELIPWRGPPWAPGPPD